MDIISICHNNILIESMLKYEKRLKTSIKYLNILVKVLYRDCCQNKVFNKELVFSLPMTESFHPVIVTRPTSSL